MRPLRFLLMPLLACSFFAADPPRLQARGLEDSAAQAAGGFWKLWSAADPSQAQDLPVPEIKMVSEHAVRGGPGVRRYEIDIKALPAKGEMHVRTKIFLQGAGRFDFDFTRPLRMTRFIDLSTGRDVPHSVTDIPGLPAHVGIHLLTFEVDGGGKAPVLLMEYVYDAETFFGYAPNPATNDNLVLGQITKDSIYSSHLNYYPVRPDMQAEEALITIEAPSGWTAVTSGELLGTEASPDGGLKHRYKPAFGSGLLPYPLAIAKYAQETLLFDGRLPVTIYFAEAHRKFAQEKLDALSGKILPFLENLMGEFPWERLRIVEVFPKEGNTGLAAKGLVMLSDKIWFAEPIGGDYSSDPAQVLVDELAHQWNVYRLPLPNYLAEGMSQYTDALFQEHVYGREALAKEVDAFKAGYRGLAGLLNRLKELRKAGKTKEQAAKELGVAPESLDPYWAHSEHGEVPISDPRVLPSMYFLKGAVALHALRAELGDEVFFRGFRALFSQPAGGEFSLDQFRAVFEKASGRKLARFFKTWYQGTGLPDF